MGGLQGLPFIQQQQPPDIEQSASQALPQMAQSLQNQQQSSQQPQQPQQQQQGQQPDPIEQLKASLAQQATPTAPPSGGPVRQLLQNFFHGMGQGMLREAGLPTDYEKQQRALANLATVTSGQSNLALHQAIASQYAPVPLVGLDGQPITDPTTGKVISLPQNHAATFYAGQQQAAARIQVGQGNNATATTVQGMRGDTAETIQNLKNQAAGNALQSKLDMFKQSQEYNVWKTNQDNQTKRDVAQMTGNKAPAAMMQTAAFAQSGLNRLDDAQAAMQRLEARGVLGNVASNKLEDWIFGNGLVDPTLPPQDKEDIGKLRAAASYTSSAAMRAHTGRTSREVYDDFKNTMGINQGPDAWKGAMQETRSMLNDYAQGATNAAVQKLRGTAPAQPPSGMTPFQQWQASQRK